MSTSAHIAALVEEIEKGLSEAPPHDHDHLAYEALATLAGRIEIAEQESWDEYECYWKQKAQAAEKQTGELRQAMEWEQEHGGCSCRTCLAAINVPVTVNGK